MTDHALILEARQLQRHFGGLRAVDDASLSLKRGELHALIGTNGAGKSTLINLLSGELPLSSGSLRFDGQEISSWSQARRARAGIGRSYQRSTLFEQFSVWENCRLAAQAAAQRPWHLWQSARHCAHSSARADVAIEAAGLGAVADRYAGLLSHGQKRQLEIAMCLATGPRVLLLDEPLAGMGAEETERMLALLMQLKQAHALLLVEHDMDAVFRVADRITVMVNGQVIACDSPEKIRAHPAVKLAYLGQEHE